MRVLVLGGTRFIGRALVAELLDAGHVVAVVHRGKHEAGIPPEVHHIHTERSQLAAHREELARFSPDAVVDLSAMTAADVEAPEPTLDRSLTVVAVSSMDVYRAFSSLYEETVTDAVPLTEDAPLRTGPSPDRDFVPPGWNHEPGVYEKLDVERIHLERGAIVCRLPMTYGEYDYRRREDFMLCRARAGRSRIPFGPGTFLWSRGYAPELARGLRLACERGGRGEIFNLCERECATVRLWAEEILAVASHEAELVRVPDELLPENLGFSAEIAQPLLCDASKAGRELGWVHAPWRECVARSVRWHLAHPPETATGFAADDAALAERPALRARGS